MKIMIIGGTRFMGPYVIKKLSALGHDVMVFHRGRTNIRLSDGVRELLGDRNRLSEYRHEIEQFRPDVVLDMILLTEQQAHELNKVVSGIVKRAVIISSCDVYRNYGMLLGKEEGPASEGKLSENAPLRKNYYPYRDMKSNKNDILYNYDKILVEKAVMANRDISSTILRLPMVYGPGDYQYRFGEYIKRMADKRPAILIDEARTRWRITRGYCENCAEAICKAILNQQAGNKIYNIGEPSAREEREWTAAIARIIGWQGKIIAVPQSMLPEHLRTDYNWQYHLDIDTSAIRNELGFKEPVEADDALKRTINWQLKNPPENANLDKEYQMEDEFLAGDRG